MYDPAGHRIGANNRSGWVTDYVPMGDGNLAEYSGGSTYFSHHDELGSANVVTDQTGTVVQNQLFYPFGESWELAGTQRDGMFGKLWPTDGASGLYITPNRTYLSTYGLWLSPDPAGREAVHLHDPQTWNMYAYVRNNPTTLTDPSGLDTMTLGIRQGAQEAGQVAKPCAGSGPCGLPLSDETQTSGAATPPAPGSVPDVSMAEGDKATQQREVELTNIVYNETSGLRADPNAKPGQAGSAEDLQNGRVAVAEIANRVIDSGHPERILAANDLSSKEVSSINGGNADAINAHNGSLAAARQALAGSDTTNGATQYRTRFGSNVTTPIGNSKGHPGTPVSQHFGPFPIGNPRREVIVVAP